jgi:hypothetical protein
VERSTAKRVFQAIFAMHSQGPVRFADLEARLGDADRDLLSAVIFADEVNTTMRAFETQARVAWPAFAIAIGFFFFFLALRTNDYTSVDGALRCLAVFFRGHQFHGNNHLLYLFWVEMWAKLASSVGIRAQDAFQFIRISQAMNAFACAAAVGCVYYLIASLASTTAAVLGSLIFGLSSTVTLQATTSDEAPSGLFFAALALAILVYGLRNNRRAMFFLAGFCMTTALASYEAAGAVVGMAVLLCCFWPSESPGKLVTAIRRLVITGAGSAVGIVVIYGWVYASQGVPVSKMPATLLSPGGSPEVYTGIDLLPSKILNTPFGLIQWLFSALPADYSGTRALLHDLHHSHRWFWFAVVGAGFALLAVIFLLALRSWRRVGFAASGFQVVLVFLAIAFITLPIWAWGPNYAKMWLLPLACLSFAIAVAWDRDRNDHLHRVFTACLAACLVAETARNVPAMIRDHTKPTPCLADARAVAEIVAQDDWVMLDFDNVSTLWTTIYGEKIKSLTLPASTAVEATEWLEKAKAATRTPGHGRLFFVGVLQASRAQWDPFLGARVKIPYELMDEYRKESTLVRRMSTTDPPIELRQYAPLSQ